MAVCETFPEYKNQKIEMTLSFRVQSNKYQDPNWQKGNGQRTNVGAHPSLHLASSRGACWDAPLHETTRRAVEWSGKRGGGSKGLGQYVAAASPEYRRCLRFRCTCCCSDVKTITPSAAPSLLFNHSLAACWCWCWCWLVLASFSSPLGT